MLTPRRGLRDLLRRAQGPSLDRGTGENIIQAPHIKRRIQRALNLKEMAPVPALASEALPVILVDDLTHEKSDQSREWMQSAEYTSGVGSIAQLEFGVPPETHGYSHIEGIWLRLVTAQVIRWAKNPYPLQGTAIVNAAQTLRGRGVTLSAVNSNVPFEIRKQDAAILLTSGTSHALSYNTTFPFYPFDLDVYPGEIFILQSGNSNVSLECCLQCTSIDNPA